MMETCPKQKVKMPMKAKFTVEAKRVAHWQNSLLNTLEHVTMAKVEPDVEQWELRSES